jgi:hypothetical protein
MIKLGYAALAPDPGIPELFIEEPDVVGEAAELLNQALGVHDPP